MTHGGDASEAAAAELGLPVGGGEASEATAAELGLPVGTGEASKEVPAMIQSGFKGKRASKKFGRYDKRGGNKKRNYTPSHNPTNDNKYFQPILAGRLPKSRSCIDLPLSVPAIGKCSSKTK